MNTSHVDEPLFDGHLETWRLALTSALCFLITSFSAAAGIGGGGLLVPTYAVVLGLGAKLAVPVSKATIFGVAVGNGMVIVRRKHPTATCRPLVDYNIAVLMQAGVLLGVAAGVLLNTILPEIVLVVTLAIVLGFNAYKTLSKARRMWLQESRAKIESGGGGDGPKAAGAKAADVNAADARAVAVSEELVTAQLLQLAREDQTQYPLWAWGSLLQMLAFLILHSLLMSGHIDPSVTPCSDMFWLLYALPLPVYVSLLAFFSSRNHRGYKLRAQAGHDFEGELQWTQRASVLLPLAAVCSGAMSGMLGIGGGMMLGPLLLSLSLDPQVSAATTGLMLIFTGAAGASEYLAVGLLPWRYALWFGGLGFAGGQTGQRVVRRMVERSGRPSLVVCLLGAVIAAAVICMTAIGVVNIAARASHHEPIGAFHVDRLRCHGEGGETRRS